MAGAIILSRHGDLLYTTERRTLRDVLNPSDIGTIAATGALAHDIGNPPFGHSGENAIRYWFNSSEIAKQFHPLLSGSQISEFQNWEGNAEGFRILARQQMARNRGGLQLTVASLGAYAKYPTAATSVAATDAERRNQAAKKPGFFDHDRIIWDEVATELGLIKASNTLRWCRHPLAYLTEAADDLCYRIIDLEDGFRLGRVSYDDLEELFVAVAGNKAKEKIAEHPDEDDLDKVTHLRALVFAAVVKEVVSVFADNERAILDGTFEGDILEKLTTFSALREMKRMAVKKVYSTPSVVEIEAAGFEIIPGLLDAFGSAVNKSASETALRNATSGNVATSCPKSSKLLALMPSEFLGKNRIPEQDPYIRLLGVVDFVAGMTDSFALTLFRRIKGVALPS